VWLDLHPIGLGTVSLYDRNDRYFGDYRFRWPVEGLYSFAMIPHSSILPGGPIHLTLSQTGDVPADAQTLRFTSFGREVAVFISGAEIPVSYTYGPTPCGGPGFPCYPDLRLAEAVADISAFAGQTVEISFRSLDTYGTGAGVNGLDSIFFSSVPIPEPGPGRLVGGGLLVLGGVRWTQRKRARK
jgi:hypothetical protein